jgi:hypothetical protein
MFCCLPSWTAWHSYKGCRIFHSSSYSCCFTPVPLSKPSILVSVPFSFTFGLIFYQITWHHMQDSNFRVPCLLSSINAFVLKQRNKLQAQFTVPFIGRGVIGLRRTGIQIWQGLVVYSTGITGTLTSNYGLHLGDATSIWTWPSKWLLIPCHLKK